MSIQLRNTTLANGTVVEWGDNGYDELDLAAGLSGVHTISAGGFHGLAITYPTATPLVVVPPKSGKVFPVTKTPAYQPQAIFLRRR